MNVKEILKKVEETPVPQVKKVAVAYSGGLDSTLGIEMLRRKYKAQEIVAICIDVGQGGPRIGGHITDFGGLGGIGGQTGQKSGEIGGNRGNPVRQPEEART
jgi:hypothetical protein